MVSKAYEDFEALPDRVKKEYKVLNKMTPITQPCEDWKWVYEHNMWLMLIISGTLAGINFLCVFIFEIIVVLEKHHTFEQ